MASSMIHIAVTSEINKTINKNRKDLLIGTISPDLGQILGISKDITHFQKEKDIPDLQKFLDKYKDNLDDDFVLGYYIHLYTDYIWFKYFMPNFLKDGYIYKLDGTKIKLENSEEENYYYKKYIYNDYTNLNITLIDKYDLKLDIFYEELPKFNNIIKEIPMSKIDVIVNKAGVIIENTKVNKAYVFDMDIIDKFVEECKVKIIDDLKKLGIC